jgi:CobQ-like glutamine amidotransferase family enzyme
MREIEINVKSITTDSSLEAGEIDLYFFGGGQDQQQVYVSQHMQQFKEIIAGDLAKGAVALTICGGYQLFGRSYHPFDGADLIGLDIFPIETFASNTRMINNLIVKIDPSISDEIKEIYTTDCEIPTTLVGFENHSGQTQLDRSAQVLGKTLYGYGNNQTKQSEGCRHVNAFGTYMHGSLLPKNPHFADYLLYLALRYRYQQEIKLVSLEDTFALKAHAQILQKYT